MPRLKGTMIEGAPPASPDLIGNGDKTISSQRSAIFKRIGRTRSRLGSHTKKLNADVQKGLAGAKMDKGVLDEKSLKRVSALAKRKAGATVHRIAQDIRSQVRTAMRQSLVAQNKVLEDSGRKGLGAAEREAIVSKQLSKWGGDESPKGSGKTISSRVRAHKKKLADKIDHELRRVRPGEKGLDRLRADLGEVIDGRGSNRTGVKGGSTNKQMVRLSAYEQARKSNDAAVEMLIAAGVTYARWTLNPLHPWYGGKEICEVMANKVDRSIIEELEAQGISTVGMDLRGVYRLSEWPESPHPFCMCGVNPFFP